MYNKIYSAFILFLFFAGFLFFGTFKIANAACCGCNTSTDSYGACTVSDSSCSSLCAATPTPGSGGCVPPSLRQCDYPIGTCADIYDSCGNYLGNYCGTAPPSCGGGGGGGKWPPIVVVPTSTPTPTPTATPTPNPHWVKLKDTSFSSVNDLDNGIPSTVSSFDADDDGSRYFIISSVNNDPGLTLARSINLNMTDPSLKKWKITLNKATPMSSSDFSSYVKSRKDFKTITTLDEITASNYNKQILVLTGSVTIDDTNKSVFNNRNLVLIINGNLNFNLTTFSPTSSYIAFLTTEKITFANTTAEAHGIFISPTIDLGINTNLGIKIVGNLVALNSLINEREWTNNSIPAVFVVFDQYYYINLLPYLSTASYQWNQTQ